MNERDKYIRPSSLGAIALCSARPTMEAHVVAIDGEPVASEVADLGHQLHERAESIVLSVVAGTFDWEAAIEYEAANMAADEMDSWSIFCVRYAVGIVASLVRKHDIEIDNILTEHSLDMASLGFTQNGTADVILVVPGDLALVIDHKFGYIDQGDASEHDQLQAYAAAAAATFNAKRVIVALIQPRAEKENRITQATFDADSLRKNSAWTKSVINLARAENPPLTAGYEQCKFCRALSRCPESRKKIMDAKEALEMLGQPLDDDGFGELADAAKLTDRFAEVAKEMAKDRLLAGGSVTGWRLGNPRAMRTVTDIPAAIQKLEAAGLGGEAMEAVSMSASKLSPLAVSVIESHITEKLSSPPLTQNKGRK